MFLFFFHMLLAGPGDVRNIFFHLGCGRMVIIAQPGLHRGPSRIFLTTRAYPGLPGRPQFFLYKWTAQLEKPSLLLSCALRLYRCAAAHVSPTSVSNTTRYFALLYWVRSNISQYLFRINMSAILSLISLCAS